MTTNNMINAGEAIYQVLKKQNINTVFGLLGGSMLELYDALYKHGDIDYIGARDERAAGHMADSFARISGAPGIVLGGQAGPGVINLATSVAEAYLAYSPLVVLAGAISRRDMGKDTFQEVDQVQLFSSVCKRSILVTSADQLVSMFEDALRLAMAGRKGPVVLHVPRDIFQMDVLPPSSTPVSFAQAGGVDKNTCKKILRALESSSKPVIIAGGGLKWSNGSKALIQLSESLKIPVVAATGHADVMPSDHTLYAGQGGPRGNRVASQLTRESDCLLVLGSRLGFNSTFHSNDYISSTATIIQIDIEARSIGRYFPVTIGVQADARITAESLYEENLTEYVPSQSQQQWVSSFLSSKEDLAEERCQEGLNDTTPMHPTRALAEIRKSLPRDAIVTLDTGNVCLQAADRLCHYTTPGLVTPLDFGLVGFGYAAAIGAQAAKPNRPVLSIMGDGGFGFTMSEINTAVRYHLPVIAIILDNGAWGAEKAYQNEFYGGRLLGANLNNPSFANIAENCGADGYTINNAGEIPAAIKQAISNSRPTVIHIKTDPNALSTLRKDLFKKPS